MTDDAYVKVVRRIKVDVGMQATAFVIAVILALTTSDGVRTFAVVASAVMLVSLIWRVTVLVYTIRHPDVTTEDG